MANRPYDDPLAHIHGAGSQSIPMFNQHGTALSQEEREAIAKKKGICVRCGVKTHDVKLFTSKALTNDHVYMGICLRDYPSKAPTLIVQAWEAKYKTPLAAVQTAGTRHKFRTVAHAAQFTTGHSGGNHNHNGTHAGSGSAAGNNRTYSPTPSPRISAHPGNGRSPSTALPRESPKNPSLHHFEPQPLSTKSSPMPITHPTENARHSRHGSPSEALSPLPSGSDHIANEDYTGGNSTDDGPQLLKVLRENSEKPTVLKQALHRLRNLGEDHAGTLSEIRQVMHHFSNDSRLMATACGALWSVSALNDDKKVEAAGLGSIKDVIDALSNQNNQRDTDFVAWAIGSLACLSRGVNNKEVIVDAGGIDVIIECLQRHPNSAAVLEWSARTLHSLVHSYESEVDSMGVTATHTIRKNIIYIDDADCIPALVTAMKNHSSETIAQLWAIKLLWRLQDRDDEPSCRRVIQKMSDESVVQVLVKVFKARSTTPVIYEFTASLMFNILAGSRSQNLPDEASDCLRITLRMMEEHLSNESLQEACCRLLSVLAGGSKLQMKEANGLSTVVATMTRFPKNLEIQESSSWILWSMSYIPTFFDYTVLSEAFDAMQITVQTHRESPSFLTGVCGLIANIVLSNYIIANDIPVNFPILALSLKVEEHRLFDEAGRALVNMCLRSEKLSRKVVDNNGIQALVACLESSSGHMLVGVVGALSGIANISSDNKAMLISAGCLLAAKSQLLLSGSGAITEKVLELISAIVTGENRNAIQLPNDIFVVIIQAMKRQLRSDHSMLIACNTIRNLLCVSTPGTHTLVLDGIIDYMVEIITDQELSVSLKVEGCEVLWALTARHHKQNASDVSTMFRSLLECISLYKGDDKAYNAELQSSAVGALASVTRCIRDNPIHISNEEVEDVIAVMYMAMENDVNHVELFNKFLEVMLNLSFCYEGKVIHCGGIVVVIDAMVEHEQEECIQEKGCSILALLSSTENLQVNLCIAETDGIDIVMNALAVFSSNERIQVDACKALSHLSVDHESRMLIAAQGGLILVVNAMTSNLDNIDLLENACAVLLNLSSDADEQVLADSNVIETVVNLMNYHTDSPMLQEKALGVLQNVSMRNSTSKAIICQAGGVSAVAIAIKEYMGSPSVLERAFTTLWSLAVLERNQVEIANSNGISLVVNGMMANISCEKVQKQACGCLCTLSSNSRNKTLIREAGGVDAIVYAMWAHYDVEALQIEACRALSSLAVNVQTNEVMIATDGEINAIISAMRRFPSSAKLQEHACVALRNFILSQDNADLIRSNRGELVGLLQHAASQFPEKCQDRAEQILMSLS